MARWEALPGDKRLKDPTTDHSRNTPENASPPRKHLIFDTLERIGFVRT